MLSFAKTFFRPAGLFVDEAMDQVDSRMSVHSGERVRLDATPSRVARAAFATTLLLFAADLGGASAGSQAGKVGAGNYGVAGFGVVSRRAPALLTREALRSALEARSGVDGAKAALSLARQTLRPRTAPPEDRDEAVAGISEILES